MKLTDELLLEFETRVKIAKGQAKRERTEFPGRLTFNRTLWSEQDAEIVLLIIELHRHNSAAIEKLEQELLETQAERDLYSTDLGVLSQEMHELENELAGLKGNPEVPF